MGRCMTQTQVRGLWAVVFVYLKEKKEIDLKVCLESFRFYIGTEYQLGKRCLLPSCHCFCFGKLVLNVKEALVCFWSAKYHLCNLQSSGNFIIPLQYYLCILKCASVR